MKINKIIYKNLKKQHISTKIGCSTNKTLNSWLRGREGDEGGRQSEVGCGGGVEVG